VLKLLGPAGALLITYIIKLVVFLVLPRMITMMAEAHMDGRCVHEFILVVVFYALGFGCLYGALVALICVALPFI
jgi:hypothetical protein